MAIDDVSFITVTGIEISRSYLVEQMIGFYNLLLEAGETKVTDFNEGSEIRNLLESIAVDSYIVMEDKNELTKIGFIETAEGEFLDLHGAHPSVNLPRDTGMEAEGFVTFSVEERVQTETIIPEGTIVVNSETGLEYITLTDAILAVNEDNVVVSIECLTTGSDGNCDIGAIDEIDEIVVDIPTLSVKNEKPITGGTDYEEDIYYRQRLLEFKQKDDFGSFPYYLRLADGIEGVHDIFLVDEEVEEGETPNFTKIVLVNGVEKPTPSSVLAEVLSVYTDVNNRVIGHNFGVDIPKYCHVDLSIELDVNVEISNDIITQLVNEIFNGGNSIQLGLEFEGFYMGENISSEIFNSNIS